MVDYAQERDIPVVPILFEDLFRTVGAGLRKHRPEPSLGGEREGVDTVWHEHWPRRYKVCERSHDEQWSKGKPCRVVHQLSRIYRTRSHLLRPAVRLFLVIDPRKNR